MIKDQLQEVIIIGAQFKEQQLFEIYCENIGWQFKRFETVSDALPYVSTHSVDQIFIDSRALTNFQYDLPRLESCVNSHTKVVLCINNRQELLTFQSTKIKIVSEPFAVNLFLKEMFGEKRLNLCIKSQENEMLNLIIGDSPSTKETRRFCFKYKSNTAPLLICGSSGSGKKFIAKTISQLSEDKNILEEVNILQLVLEDILS
jgi:DNA-binding NtrC family response regulator